MTNAAGHSVTVDTSLDGVTYTEADGVVDVDVQRTRPLVDNSAYSTTGHRKRLAGIRDCRLTLSGLVAFNGSLQLDSGLSRMIQRCREGKTIYVNRTIDGSAEGFAGLVTDLELSADAGGPVAWSAVVQGSGVGWAPYVAPAPAPPAGFSSRYVATNVDGSNNATLSDGGNVTAWTDLGSDGRNLAQQSGQLAAIFRATGGPSGGPAVDFTAVSGNTTYPLLVNTFGPESVANLTIALVVRNRASNLDHNTKSPFTVGDEAGNDRALPFTQQGGNSSALVCNSTASSPTVGGGAQPAPKDSDWDSPMSAFRWAIFEWQSGAGRIKTRNVEVTGNPGYGGTLENFTMGNIYGARGVNSRPSNMFTGKIYEVLVYKSVSPTLRADLVTYLNTVAP